MGGASIIGGFTLRFIGDYVDIICALINAFKVRSVKDVDKGSELAFRMLDAYNESNNIQLHLSKIVTERSEWRKYDAKMCPFPELDEGDLQHLCFGRKLFFISRMAILFFSGSYQIKQAGSYIKDHLTPSTLKDDELEFIVELSPKYDNIVRARFTSRHSNTKTYISIVQYNVIYTEHPIKGWFCTCVIGGRHIGCCAHVAALL